MIYTFFRFILKSTFSLILPAAMLFIIRICVSYVLYVYMCVPSFSQTRHCSGSPSKAFQQSRQDLFLSFPAFILQPSLEETACTRVRLLDLPCHCTDSLTNPNCHTWVKQHGFTDCMIDQKRDILLVNYVFMMVY